MSASALIACHECDLLQREIPLPLGAAARCRRCGMVLYRNLPDSLDRTLALTLAAAVLYIVANAFPIVGLDAQGNRTSTTLFGAVRTLYEQDMTSVAALVFATTIVVPAVELGAMLYMLLPLKLGRVPRGLPDMFRLLQTIRPWGMVEVFLLGTLVSLAKLAHLASLVPGIALWSFAVLMVLLAAAASSFDPHGFWTRVEAEEARQ
jgi:paraquat-inducible protein A